MLSIKQHWESFAEQVLPKDLSQSQLNTMRAVFYSGALVASTIYYEIVESDLTVETAATRLKAIQEELRLFEQEMAE